MSFIVSESGSEPLLLADVKTWAKVENDDEDTLITSLITSCRREIESFTKCVLRPQIWQTEYILDKGQYIFYSPRFFTDSVEITIDDDAYTDFVYNRTTGRVKLNSQFYANDELVITWNVETQTESFTPLKQALLDLITYRFYNRGLYDMPDNVKTILNMYRIFNL